MRGNCRLALLVCACSLVVFCQEPTDTAKQPVPRLERMIDVGGRSLHCRVFGTGGPVVVLLSGLGAEQDNWNGVIPALAAVTTVLTYDRAGVGRSELGSRPAHGEQSARDLRALLRALELPGPYVLVGHSLGGFVARLFAAMFPQEVSGLVLEEVQHEDNLLRARTVLKGKDLEEFERIAAAMEATPANPMREADYREVTRTQIRNSPSLPQIPLLIITVAGRAKAMPPVFSAEALEALDRLDVEMMRQLAASVSGGTHTLVSGTDHFVHVDKPELLTAPVLKLIESLAAKKR